MPKRKAPHQWTDEETHTLDSMIGRCIGRGTLVQLYDRIVDCKRGASLAARTRAVLHRVHVPSRSASASRARAMLAIRHAVLDELCERTRCRDEKLVRGVLRQHPRSTVDALTEKVLDLVRPRCEICLERGTAQRMRRLAPISSESYSRSACGHAFCQRCWKRHVNTQVQAGKGHVLCPAVGCHTALLPPDLVSLGVSQRTRKKFAKNREANGQKHYAEFIQSSANQRWLDSVGAKCCPSCSVLIEKDGGCDQVSCTCGHTFNWHYDETVDSDGEGDGYTLEELNRIRLAESMREDFLLYLENRDF